VLLKQELKASAAAAVVVVILMFMTFFSGCFFTSAEFGYEQ